MSSSVSLTIMNIIYIFIHTRVFLTIRTTLFSFGKKSYKPKDFKMKFKLKFDIMSR